jgi:hypothetical protein
VSLINHKKEKKSKQFKEKIKKSIYLQLMWNFDPFLKKKYSKLFYGSSLTLKDDHLQKKTLQLGEK